MTLQLMTVNIVKYITPQYIDIQDGQSVSVCTYACYVSHSKVFDLSFVHLSFNYVRIHFNILKAFFRIL